VELARPEQFGRYLVYEQIGIGGMATVHRATRDGKDGTREVALKRLLSKVAAQVDLRRMFLNEGQLTRVLKHQNIAETYESGTYRETAFIAMEYLPGPTLKQLVQHCGMTVGSVPTPIVLNVAAQICDALDYAHTLCDSQGKPLGIIHRDVSPSNMIVCDTGLVKLIDFGLAKARMGKTTHTARGVIKGKFNYVAPEYIGGKLDARADLWALGVVMYELLTSRRLFDGINDIETMTRVRLLPIPRPSLVNHHVSPQLDEVVMTALERNPDRRWQSAADMRDALQAVIDEPGNAIGHDHVVEWTKWVFTQEQGTQQSGMATLLAMVEPTEIKQVDIIEGSVSLDTEARKNRRVLLPVFAILIVVFVIELLIR
jgi:eukaryotic-like serine/threonine-protein kinase